MRRVVLKQDWWDIHNAAERDSERTGEIEDPKALLQVINNLYLFYIDSDGDLKLKHEDYPSVHNDVWATHHENGTLYDVAYVREEAILRIEGDEPDEKKWDSIYVTQSTSAHHYASLGS